MTQVLVVEDEPVLLDLVGEILELDGYEPLLAATGDAALRLAEEAPSLALAILDLELGGIRGPELARALRAVLPDLRVVFSSGWGDDGSDGDAFVAKPYTAGELLDCVRDVLAA